MKNIEYLHPYSFQICNKNLTIWLSGYGPNMPIRAAPHKIHYRHGDACLIIVYRNLQENDFTFYLASHIISTLTFFKFANKGTSMLLCRNPGEADNWHRWTLNSSKCSWLLPKTVILRILHGIQVIYILLYQSKQDWTVQANPRHGHPALFLCKQTVSLVPFVYSFQSLVIDNLRATGEGTDIH